VQEQERSSLSDFQNDNILEGDGNVRRREERRAAGSAVREEVPGAEKPAGRDE